MFRILGNVRLPQKKINQRLFKRLILYYNVGEASSPAGKISTKADSAPSAPADDSRQAVRQTTRARPAGTGDPSAALPFGMAGTGTGTLTMLTDVSRDLYLFDILPCF